MAALDIVIGVAFGYLMATLNEALFHKNVHHAGKQTLHLWKRYKSISKPFMEAYFSHTVIHHFKTFRINHITQFKDSNEEDLLKNYLKDRKSEYTIKENYGLTLDKWGFVKYNIPAIALLLVLFFLVNPVVLIGLILPMLSTSLLSKFVHPYLHMSQQQAVKKAPWFMAMILKTRYMRKVYMHHYLHHKYQNCNYNLLLGGDIILGVHKEPSERDIEEMVKIGLISK